jgi:hypothetical protein
MNATNVLERVPIHTDALRHKAEVSAYLQRGSRAAAKQRNSRAKALKAGNPDANFYLSRSPSLPREGEAVRPPPGAIGLRGVTAVTPRR